MPSCALHELSRPAFFHAFARHVAAEFVEGSLAFWSGNYAMNALGGVALEELDDFAQRRRAGREEGRTLTSRFQRGICQLRVLASSSRPH